MYMHRICVGKWLCGMQFDAWRYNAQEIVTLCFESIIFEKYIKIIDDPTRWYAQHTDQDRLLHQHDVTTQNTPEAGFPKRCLKYYWRPWTQTQPNTSTCCAYSHPWYVLYVVLKFNSLKVLLWSEISITKLELVFRRYQHYIFNAKKVCN